MCVCMCAWKSKVDGTGVGIMILRWSSADLEMHQFGEAVWPMCSKDLQDNVSKAACGSVDLELTGSEDSRKPWLTRDPLSEPLGARIDAKSKRNLLFQCAGVVPDLMERRRPPAPIQQEAPPTS